VTVVLAVADEPSHLLEHFLASPAAESWRVDLLVSCGDLDWGYLDSVATGVRRTLYYVPGNHQGRVHDLPTDRDEPRSRRPDPSFGSDLHGRVEEAEDWLLCGFGGARWYRPGDEQYTEAQMRRLIRRVARQIRWRHLWDRWRGRPERPVLVISHAPPAGIHDRPGTPHEGFACFRWFLETIRPRLWLHGHVHLSSVNQIQRTDLPGVTIANAYEFKLIRIDGGRVEVGYQIPLGGDPPSAPSAGV
jgi:uncharacterized protein